MPKKGRKVLIMVKAAKLGWAGPGPGQEQGRRAGAELTRVEQSRSKKRQELGRSWAGARNVQDKSLEGVGQGRSTAGAGIESNWNLLHPSIQKHVYCCVAA